MRGKTVKKIKKFVATLIEATPEAERNKTKDQMIKEAKCFWYTSPKAKKFINFVLAGKESQCKLAS